MEPFTACGGSVAQVRARTFVVPHDRLGWCARRAAAGTKNNDHLADAGAAAGVAGAAARLRPRLALLGLRRRPQLPRQLHQMRLGLPARPVRARPVPLRPRLRPVRLPAQLPRLRRLRPRRHGHVPQLQAWSFAATRTSATSWAFATSPGAPSTAAPARPASASSWLGAAVRGHWRVHEHHVARGRVDALPLQGPDVRDGERRGQRWLLQQGAGRLLLPNCQSAVRHR